MKHMGATSTKTTHEYGLKVFAILLMTLGLPGIWVSSTLAQAPITSSGLNTQVNLSTSPTVPAGKVQYDITGGTRPGGGANLFHSFGNFNVPNNNIANFLNSGSVDLAGNPLAAGLPTSNILGRVTGGNISNIFGMIQTNGPGGFGNANLFLMNPAGFLFGPNATVNVGGMVAFTTADYLRLSDGKLFNAIPDAAADALLSAAPVAAFGFLGSNPGAITVQGSQFTVTPSTGISLIGGNITVQNGTLDNGTVQPAKLSAPGGQIQLASVASPGEILAGTLAQAPNVNGQTFGALGSVNVSQKSVIDVSGNGGGTVLIRGGQFVLDNSSIFANITGSGPITNGVESIGGGIDIQASQGAVIQNAAVLTTNVSASTTSGVTYGGMQVKADHIEIVGTGPPSTTKIQSDVSTGAPGASSGDITLEANSILIKGGATLETVLTGSATHLSTGHGGNINVTANQNIELDGLTTIRSILNNSSGTGGNITLTSRHGSIVESGTSVPPGFTGVPPPINPNIIFDQATGSSTGKPGNLTFNAPEGDILLAGAVMNISILSAVQAGGGGQLLFNTNNLQLINNSFFAVDNFSTLPAGNFNVTLNGNLTLNSSQIVTTARGPAQAAGLNITAHDVLVTNGGLLSTQTKSSGPGGHLNISADTIEVTSGGQITSGSAIPVAGAGGTINIQGLAGPAASVLIDGARSAISTTTVGTGAGGNTNITAQSLTVQNGGAISASTTGTGAGGSVAISAGQLTLNSGGSITANSSGSGNAGTVTVQGLPGSASAVMIDGAGSGIHTDTTSTGAGGDIFVAANSVTLQNGGALSSTTSGMGNAGNISILADQVSLTNLSQITTSTSGQGTGGTIDVSATNSISVVDSFISASANSVQTGAGSGGQITLQAPTIDVAGGDISTLTLGPGNAGDIQIQAGTFKLGASESGFGLVEASTSGTGRGGNISVLGVTGPGSRASDVLLSGLGSFRSDSQTSNGGTAGNISVETVRLSLTEGSAITTTSLNHSPGNAGNVTLNATESVLISGGSITSDILQGSTGHGGQITITTPTLTVNQGSDGFGGLIPGLISTSTSSSGGAGSVTINANSVTLTDGGRVASNSFLEDPIFPAPTGAAGNVVMQGSAGSGTQANSIVISGQDGFGSASGIFTNTQGTGAGGNISLNANSVTLQNGGTLSVATSGTAPSATGGTITVKADTVTLTTGGTMTAASSGPGASGEVVVQGLASAAQSIFIDGSGSGIFTDTRGTGTGGDIHLSSSSVTLQNGATLSATTSGTLPSAIGGSISVNATDVVTMTNGGLITASSTGPGNAGNISINAGQQLQMQNSSIKTEAAQAGGGNINIQAVELIRAGNSTISTSVLGGGGSGGNITIDPNIVLLENSQILAQAVQGAGGNISITTNLLLADINSTISASSQFGQQGTISIQSPISPASGKILPLSNRPLIATSLLNQRCAALAGGNFSSFTVAGRDSLPAEPGGWLSSPLALVASEPVGTLTNTSPRPNLSESAEEAPLISLRQIAPSGFLTHTFAVNSEGGCES